MDVVTDAARIGAVFVSAPPSAISTEAWTSTIEEIVRGTDVMAVTYVLSPEAHRAFSGLVGASHSFGAGSLRTYLPGAIPGDAGDSFWHRVLGYATIRASHPRRLGHVVRSAQIDRVETLRLPTLLLSVDYALLRASRRQPLIDLGALRERSSSAEGDADALTQVNAELTAALETERGLEVIVHGTADEWICVFRPQLHGGWELEARGVQQQGTEPELRCADQHELRAQFRAL